MTRRLLRDESGAILVLIALLLPVLLGMVGLAMDAAHLYLNRRRMQGVADLAALAAAQKADKGEGQVRKAARDMAAANGFTHGTGNKNVQVQTPFESQKDLVQVVLRDSIPTFFVRVLGIQGARVRVSAVARAKKDAPVIWAQGTSCSTATGGQTDLPFYYGGGRGVWTIPLHSNGSMVLGGSTSTFLAKITYGCELVANSNNTYNPPPERVSARSWPLNINPQSWKCDFYSAGDFDVSAKGPWWANFDLRLLKPGVYCAEGKISLKTSYTTGKVSFYGKNGVEVKGKNLALSAFVDNVLFWSNATGNALVVEGSGGVMSGMLVARNGLLKYTGSENAFFNGSMLAMRISISGSDWEMIGGVEGSKSRVIQ